MNGLSPSLGAVLPAWWEPARPTDAAVGPSDRMVLLLYSEALTLVRRAQAAPRTARRDAQVVLGILSELSSALAARDDRDSVIDLLSLYRYMSHRLSTARLGPDSDALAEVEHLFVTLFDGWIQVLQGESPGGFPESLEADDSRAAPTSLLSP
ncbi:MAG: flagellar export chaperone FliS [Nitrospirota bacterium]